MNFEDIILEVPGMLIRGVYTEGRVSDSLLMLKGRRFPFRYELYSGENTRYGGLSEGRLEDDVFEGTLLLADFLDAYLNEDGEFHLEGVGYIRFVD